MLIRTGAVTNNSSASRKEVDNRCRELFSQNLACVCRGGSFSTGERSFHRLDSLVHYTIEAGHHQQGKQRRNQHATNDTEKHGRSQLAAGAGCEGDPYPS